MFTVGAGSYLEATTAIPRRPAKGFTAGSVSDDRQREFLRRGGVRLDTRRILVLLTGVKDRLTLNKRNIEATLRAVKERAEES